MEVHSDKQLIRKRVRQILFESYSSDKFVIMNANSESSTTELPNVFYNASMKVFVNDIRQATIFVGNSTALIGLGKAVIKFPDAELGIYPADDAQKYFAAFKTLHDKWTRSNKNSET